MITYENIIFGCWALFLVVWAVSAFNVKRDIRGGYGGWRQFWLLRLAAAAVLVIIATRVVTRTAHYTNPGFVFSRGIFLESALVNWTAAALSVIGVAIAIWARVHLGRNWSSRPAVKENHELVTSGPYAYIRHPIYTGLILMALGAAFTGSIWGICVFIAAFVIFTLRIGKEEKIMFELFPNEYPEYRKKTKALFPFVF